MNSLRRSLFNRNILDGTTEIHDYHCESLFFSFFACKGIDGAGHLLITAVQSSFARVLQG